MGEVATAIRGGINCAKCSVVPIRRGYWGAKIGAPHTVPIKLTGKCGSVRIRLGPAARGTGIVASPTSKKILQMAGIQDCYTASQGHTKTKGNFAKAAFDALSKSYGFLTPDLARDQVPQGAVPGAHGLPREEPSAEKSLLQLDGTSRLDLDLFGTGRLSCKCSLDILSCYLAFGQ